MTTSNFSRRRFRGRMSGSQILEFALTLPLLAVFVVGIFEFGGAFNLKQKLNNAVRDVSRTGAAQTFDDLPGSSSNAPASIASLKDGFVQYLKQAGVSRCDFRNATYAGAGFVYTFTAAASTNCPGGGSLVIDRAVPQVVGTSTIFLTQAQVRYPYKWSFGAVMSLIASGWTGSTPISTSAAMQDQFLP